MILTRKLIAPAVILFSILLAGLFAYFFSSLHNVYHETEEEDLASFNESFSGEVENQKQLVLALASEAAGNPAIQEALASKDQQRLSKLALPSYELLNETRGNISLYQYYLTDGFLFFNANEPTASGPSEMTQTPLVMLANKEQKPIAGLELENGNLEIRGVVPVIYRGEYIGLVEFGTGFNETLFNDLKKKYGGEWQLLLSKNNVPGVTPVEASPNEDLMVFATTQKSALFNDPSSYVRALNGESTISHPSMNGRDYAILSAPVYDYSENIIGVLDILYDHTHISTAQNSRLLVAGAVSLGALILGVFGLVLLTRRTLQPIQALTRFAAEIAEGNLSSYINMEVGRDEIGILVNAFNHMASQVRSSITGLEQRVADRTRDLENQTLRLRTAAEIARDAASARDFNSLLDRSAELIHKRFNFFHTGIYIVDINNEFVALTASPTQAGKSMITDNFRFRVGGPGIVGRVAATGQARLNLEAGRDTVHSNHPLFPNIRSEMALPLKVENRVIGVIEIQSEQPEAFNQDDLTIMQVMADQLATAIERTRLLQEVERNLFELERAYGQYTREGWQRLGASGRIGNKGYRFNNIRIEPINEYPDWGSIKQTSDRDGSSIVAPSDNQIVLPIKLRGQKVGVVHVKLKEGHDENTISTIELAIERLASALESARLHEEARIRADREQAISQITTAISSSTEFESILQTTVREIGSVFNDTEVTIQILDETDR